MENERLTLTVEEVARVLGISRGLAYELVGRQAIPSLRLGRRILVPRRVIEALLTEKGPPGLRSWMTRAASALRLV